MFDVVLRTVTWDICSKGYFIVYTALFHRFPQAFKRIRYSFSFSLHYFLFQFCTSTGYSHN